MPPLRALSLCHRFTMGMRDIAIVNNEQIDQLINLISETSSVQQRAATCKTSSDFKALLNDLGWQNGSDNTLNLPLLQEYLKTKG